MDERFNGIIYKCHFNSDKKVIIEMNAEKDGFPTAVRGNALTLNIILANDINVSEIVWYDEDDNAYDKTGVTIKEKT